VVIVLEFLIVQEPLILLDLRILVELIGFHWVLRPSRRGMQQHPAEAEGQVQAQGRQQRR
jgi:hypothetical protein